MNFPLPNSWYPVADMLPLPSQQHETSVNFTMSMFQTSYWFLGLMALAIAVFAMYLLRRRGPRNAPDTGEHSSSMTQQLKEKTEALELAQTQLIQVEKMASLGQLTAGIAHEIQNPLNFINNFSEVSLELLEELENAPDEERIALIEDLKQNMEKINFHGKRADTIVKGMLLHSRNTPGEKKPTDINKLVEEFFVLAYHGMKAKDPAFNCTMDKHLTPNLPLVKIIPQDVSRVILNIFNNSFYAVDEKSKTESRDYRPVVSIATRQLNGEIILTIRDNGKGIPEEIKDKIFTPFFTTKPAGHGTGLGLSISHDIIVKQHLGHMKLDSKAGEFTEFEIGLPL